MKTYEIFVCILYLLVACLYSFQAARNSSSWQRGLFSLVICLALPGAGLFLLLFLKWYAGRLQDKDRLEIYMDDSFHGEDLQLLQKPDSDKELNQVPMKEALNLNDFSYRRSMIMDLLNEEDILQYLDILKEALDNEDTETTHYASTIIMELQRKTQDLITQWEVQYEQNPGDPASTSKWEELLYKVIQSRLYEEHTLGRYYRKYYRVSDRLLSSDQPAQQYYLHRIQILFHEGNLTDAKGFCIQFQERFPASEEAVLCLLEFFIRAKDSQGMTEFLQRLPSLPVHLTQKTLQYIKIFQKE